MENDQKPKQKLINEQGWIKLTTVAPQIPQHDHKTSERRRNKVVHVKTTFPTITQLPPRGYDLASRKFKGDQNLNNEAPHRMFPHSYTSKTTRSSIIKSTTYETTPTQISFIKTTPHLSQMVHQENKYIQTNRSNSIPMIWTTEMTQTQKALRGYQQAR